MANFFKASSKKALTGQLITLDIDRLDFNGCGIGRYKNKPVFITGALVNEQVSVKVFEQKSKYFRAKLLDVVRPSESRVVAQCAHFKVCGGCDLQHLAFSQHLNFKQHNVTELFARHDITQVLPWQKPIIGSPWQYRRKARIGVQYNKQGHATVGFRRKATNDLCEIKNCPVLVESLSDIFTLLRQLLNKLTTTQAIGHIEVIATEQVTLIVRQLKKFTSQEQQHWLDTANKNQWQVIFDEGDKLTSLNTIKPLVYPITEQINITFEPKDFIQINHDVNVQMVEQALDWLALNSTDHVLDLFCGLGNFSLPMAKQVAQVTGVEGIQSMVDKATKNAQANAIDHCHFYQADLNDAWLDKAWAKQNYHCVLLDPARAGAFVATQQLITLNIAKVLYVSCDPATLARDSKLYLEAGYIMEKIALMDMFSQTKHIETMVLFSR